MYDRETNSYWSHLTGEAIQGPMVGEKLKMLASVPKIKWKEWKQQYPNTRVLSVQGKEYQRYDHYSEYHRSNRTGLFSRENRDDRLDIKDKVIGVVLNEARKAYPMEKKHWKTGKKDQWKLVRDEIDGTPVVVFHDPDLYATEVYSRKLSDGTVLEFAETVERFWAQDAEGRKWNLLTGQGPDGLNLSAVPHMGIYWFAWADFYPDTELFAKE